MRLIDGDALMNILQKLFDKREKEQVFTGSRGACVTWNDAIYHIKSAPTVDAVPVCRCKDCIHYEMGVCLKIYDDGAANKDAWQERNPSDFCSYGEHKGGADGADS